MRQSRYVFFAGAALVAASLVSASWTHARGGGGGGRGWGGGGGPRGGNCALPAEVKADAKLSGAQRQALVDLYEEERLAFELYKAFGEKWNLRPFLNIRESELRHREAMKALLVANRIDVPAKMKAGTFSNKELQSIHDKLLAEGRKSEAAALKAGALVEETDIRDLEAAAQASPSAQVKAICRQLVLASENHLRAFTRNLAARGVDYAPAVLDADRFKAIVGDSGGGGGKGRGRGGRGGGPRGGGAGQGV